MTIFNADFTNKLLEETNYLNFLLIEPFNKNIDFNNVELTCCQLEYIDKNYIEITDYKKSALDTFLWLLYFNNTEQSIIAYAIIKKYKIKPNYYILGLGSKNLYNQRDYFMKYIMSKKTNKIKKRIITKYIKYVEYQIMKNNTYKILDNGFLCNDVIYTICLFI